MAPRARKMALPKPRRPGVDAVGDTTTGSRPDSSATSDEASGRAERRAFRLSLAGLLTTMALASLDQNIVSTALPRIVGELGGLTHLPWMITAFMLTATATCQSCRKHSGAPVSVFTAFERTAYTVTKGEITKFSSSPGSGGDFTPSAVDVDLRKRALGD
jgi:hypothetical protein